MPKKTKSLEELNQLSGPKLRAHIRDELDAMSPSEIFARLDEVFSAAHDRDQALLSQLNELLDTTDAGFRSIRDALLEPGQRLQLVQRLSTWVELLVEGLRDEPSTCPPVCPYVSFLHELERLQGRVRHERLRDRIDSIGCALAMDDMESDLLYEQACRAIDVEEVGEAYDWEPPSPVLEMMVEASAEALRKAG